MKSGIILAVVVSIFLIGGASWMRMSNASPKANLITVEEREAFAQAYYDEVFEGFFDATSTAPKSSNSPEEALTNTDLISRQLMGDYFNLTSSGQATQADIISLANRYVESIVTLGQEVRINPLDIKVVQDTQVNLQTYADSMANIYKTNAEKLIKFYADELNDLNEANGYKSAGETGAAYESIADAFKKLPVPNSVAGAHLDLINIYYTNSIAMSSIKEMDRDPILALAGTIVISGNADKEEVALGKIQKTLEARNIQIQ